MTGGARGEGFLEKEKGGGGWAGWAQKGGEGGARLGRREAHARGGGGAAGPKWERERGREKEKGFLFF
jgi:hypothetical protein